MAAIWSSKGVFKILTLRGRAAACLLAVGASLALLVESASAVVIVNDQFRDANRTDPGTSTYSENGTDTDADGDIESAWFTSSSLSTTIVAPPAGGTGNLAATAGSTPNVMRTAIAATSNSMTNYFTPSGSPVTLAAAGDAIKVTWTFVPTGITTTGTSQGFPFALANTHGVARLTGSVSPVAGDYQGYAVYSNFRAGTLGNSNPFQLKERGTAMGNFLSTGSEWTAFTPNVSGAASGDGGYAEGDQYTLTFQITRNAGLDTIGGNGDDGVDIDVKMNQDTGTASLGPGGQGFIELTASDASPNTFAYDMFGFRPSGSGGAATQFDTTLFRVETVSTATPPPTLTGDYNGDGVVDAADYTIWRDTLGQMGAIFRRRRRERRDRPGRLRQMGAALRRTKRGQRRRVDWRRRAGADLSGFDWSVLCFAAAGRGVWHRRAS